LGRPVELCETLTLAQRLGPFGHVFTFAHVFKELRVLDAIPQDKASLLPDLPRVLARCIAIAASDVPEAWASVRE